MTVRADRHGAIRRLVTRAVAALAVTPVSLGGTVAAVVGRRSAAGRWARRLSARLGHQLAEPSPSSLAAALHGLLAAALGLLAWVGTAILVLVVLRGLLYGLVVPGPYDDAWGGPSRAGAWAVHAVVGLAISPVALALMRAVGALYVRVSARMLTGRGPRWAVPVSLLVAAATGVLLSSWATQSL